jgi:hypothetical protein
VATRPASAEAAAYQEAEYGDREEVPGDLGLEDPCADPATQEAYPCHEGAVRGDSSWEEHHGRLGVEDHPCGGLGGREAVHHYGARLHGDLVLPGGTWIASGKVPCPAAGAVEKIETSWNWGTSERWTAWVCLFWC